MNYKDFFVDSAKKILGIILIIGGILGLFLPFFQGVAMIIAGLILLGNHALLEKLYVMKQHLIEYFSRLKK